MLVFESDEFSGSHFTKISTFFFSIRHESLILSKICEYILWIFPTTQSGNMRKLFFYLSVLFLPLVLASCKVEEESEEGSLGEAAQYLLEIGFGTELGSSPRVIRKWDQPVKIFMVDTTLSELHQELRLIVSELNTLIDAVELSLTSKKSEANIIVYCGDADTFGNQYEPSSKPYLSANQGLFWLYWNTSNYITKASVFVDIVRTQGLPCQKHLLREELTQSLGIMQDSNRYPESIFQQAWTCTTSYSTIDREVIKLLYHPKLLAGMTRDEARVVLKRI
jgi:hypothetical protein